MVCVEMQGQGVDLWGGWISMVWKYGGMVEGWISMVWKYDGMGWGGFPWCGNMRVWGGVDFHGVEI